MTRKSKLGALTLLGFFGSTALQSAAAPLPTIRYAPPVAQVMYTHDYSLPAEVGVRTFGLKARVEMGVFDQGDEVVLDN